MAIPLGLPLALALAALAAPALAGPAAAAMLLPVEGLRNGSFEGPAEHSQTPGSPTGRIVGYGLCFPGAELSPVARRASGA